MTARLRDKDTQPSVYLSNYENTPVERALAARCVLRVARDRDAGRVAAETVLMALGLA